MGLCCRKEPVGLFHWADFSEYPVFNDPKDIPEIRLPVRTEHYSMEEILASFIEGVSCYFAWISNEMTDCYEPDENDVEDILQAYFRDREHSLDTV